MAVLDSVRSVKDRLTWESVRHVGSRLTTPLHPDDYLRLLNPLWTTRELRGIVEEVVRETDDAATIVIRPGWGWRYDHRPGQYIGIGLQIGGRFTWRSYSVSTPPTRSIPMQTASNEPRPIGIGPSVTTIDARMKALKAALNGAWTPSA